MDYRIEHAPIFTVVEFQLNEADEVVAQPDSMISMTSGVEITAAVGRAGGGNRWWSGFKSMLGGESMFRAVFRAKRDSQTLLLAPETYGDILPLSLAESGGMYLTRGAYFAHFGDCRVDVKYGGVKGFMAKTGLFLLHAAGTGVLFCQTYGAVVDRSLAADERILVDNRYVVAFSDTMTFDVVKSSDTLRDSMMSGEGFLNRFTGPGRLLYQTRGKPPAGIIRTLFNAMT
jgi:uncharacterized protein (TIGR00266 family)